ncbi:unnamed protein product [Polarella glacialis]|uniref:Uncharacterized protein n=2 Tax=Polarella glacialis TaxID=89957 RepID=A0A813LBJ5_POLGL|nr:unnamed protein product [Polarella glacialis]
MHFPALGRTKSPEKKSSAPLKVPIAACQEPHLRQWLAGQTLRPLEPLEQLRRPASQQRRDGLRHEIQKEPSIANAEGIWQGQEFEFVAAAKQRTMQLRFRTLELLEKEERFERRCADPEALDVQDKEVHLTCLPVLPADSAMPDGAPSRNLPGFHMLEPLAAQFEDETSGADGSREVQDMREQEEDQTAHAFEEILITETLENAKKVKVVELVHFLDTAGTVEAREASKAAEAGETKTPSQTMQRMGSVAAIGAPVDRSVAETMEAFNEVQRPRSRYIYDDEDNDKEVNQSWKMHKSAKAALTLSIMKSRRKITEAASTSIPVKSFRISVLEPSTGAASTLSPAKSGRKSTEVLSPKSPSPTPRKASSPIPSMNFTPSAKPTSMRIVLEKHNFALAGCPVEYKVHLIMEEDLLTGSLTVKVTSESELGKLKLDLARHFQESELERILQWARAHPAHRAAASKLVLRSEAHLLWITKVLHVQRRRVIQNLHGGKGWQMAKAAVLAKAEKMLRIPMYDEEDGGWEDLDKNPAGIPQEPEIKPSHAASISGLGLKDMFSFSAGKTLEEFGRKFEFEESYSPSRSSRT